MKLTKLFGFSLLSSLLLVGCTTTPAPQEVNKSPEITAEKTKPSIVDAVTATKGFEFSQLPVVEPTDFEGVYLINKSYIPDERGSTMAVFSSQLFEAYGLDFNLDDLVFTTHNKDAIRGIHFQEAPSPQVKLVGVLQGSIRDVIIDLRPDSATFKQVMAVELRADDNKLIYVPAGFGHATIALEDDTMTFFAVDGVTVPELNRGIKWDSIDYDWQVQDPIVAERDQNWPTLDTYLAEKGLQ